MNTDELIADYEISDIAYRIMTYVGYDLVRVGYEMTDDETQWQMDNRAWLDKMDSHSVGCYFADVHQNSLVDTEFFELGWTHLMLALKKMKAEGNVVFIQPDLEKMKSIVYERLA